MENLLQDRVSSHAEPSWGDRAVILVRWKTLVLGGIALSCALIVLLDATIPTPFEAEATIALPNTNTAEDVYDRLKSAALLSAGDPPPIREESQRKAPGFSIAAYKKLERSLRDDDLFTHAFGGRLNPREVALLTTRLDQHVRPLTSVGRNELYRLEKEDAITAVQLVVPAPSDAAAFERIGLFADLVRGVVIVNLTMDAMDQLRTQSAAERRRWEQERLQLGYTNRSLQQNVVLFERLVRDVPVSGASGREVVSVTEGGHRYLSPTLQLIGIRAAMAENEHRIRRFDDLVRLATIRLDFLKQLEGRIEREFKVKRVRLLDDPVALLRDEWRQFAEASPEGPQELASIGAELAGIAGQLESYRTAMHFVQKPGARLQSRRNKVVALAFLAIAFFLVLPFALEQWRRPRSPAAASA